MRHTDIWKAIDALAERHGLSASGLAKRAGLDATAFNKSKRAGADGSPRWLSTESLMKALDAVGTSLEDFAALAEGRQGHTRPCSASPRRAATGISTTPDSRWAMAGRKCAFPGLETETVYALEITGDSMEPVYRHGDRIVVAPGALCAAATGWWRAREMAKCSPRFSGGRPSALVELLSLNPAYPPRELARGDLAVDGAHRVGEPVVSQALEAACSRTTSYGVVRW
jgi:phage repressor protein C with HTH and peptisase S24 domain